MLIKILLLLVSLGGYAPEYHFEIINRVSYRCININDPSTCDELPNVTITTKGSPINVIEQRRYMDSEGVTFVTTEFKVTLQPNEQLRVRNYDTLDHYYNDTLLAETFGVYLPLVAK